MVYFYLVRVWAKMALPLLIAIRACMPVWAPPEDPDNLSMVPADPNFIWAAVYGARNKVDGKWYFGETEAFKERFGTHKRQSHKKKGDKNFKKKYFYSALRKHGWDQFEWFFFWKWEYNGELTDPEKQYLKDNFLHPAEAFLINKYGTMDRTKGYNRMRSGKGGVVSAEARAKMSAAAMGNTRAPIISVIRWQIIKDISPEEQEVTLTLYPSGVVAGRETGVSCGNITRACKNFGRRSCGGCYWSYAAGFELEFDTLITVRRVGTIPMTTEMRKQALVSVHPIANGKAVEQWHDSKCACAHALTRQSSTADNPKTFCHTSIIYCLNGDRNHHHGVHFRRVTTEKREDFNEHGTREAAFVPELYLTKKKKARNKRKRNK